MIGQVKKIQNATLPLNVYDFFFLYGQANMTIKKQALFCRHFHYYGGDTCHCMGRQFKKKNKHTGAQKKKEKFKRAFLRDWITNVV